jgi:hypothetical protein
MRVSTPRGPLRNWLVDDLIPARSTAILVGRSDLEPRTVARELALAVARGRRWAGRAVEQGSVLWVRIEDEKLESSEPPSFGYDAVHVYTAAPTFALLDEIQREARERSASLVIVDGLVSMISAEEENDDQLEMSALDRILDRGGRERCFLLLHEQRHPGEMSAVLASTSRPVDLMLTAMARERREVRLEALRASGETLDVNLLLPRDAHADAELRAQILEVLREVSQLMTFTQLHDAIPVEARWLRSQLVELRQQRRVIEIPDPNNPSRRLFTGCNPAYHKYGNSWLVRVEPWARLDKPSRRNLGPHVRA